MPEDPARSPQAPDAQTPVSPASRYGTQRPPMSRTVRLVLGTVVTVLVLGGVAWFAFAQPGDDVRGKDVGYSVKSPELVEIRFDVAKPEDSTVVCRLEALNSSYAQVGIREVTIGPSVAREARYTAEIATSEEAVTAVVESCRTVE